MRRRTLLVALAGLAVVVAAGAVVVRSRPEPGSRITVEIFRRIREGMTLAEASAILGPPGDYSTLEPAPVPRSNESAVLDGGTVERVDFKWWISDTAQAAVFLDQSGRITSGWSYPVRTVDHGTLGNLLWRLNRQWHRWFP